MVKALYGLSLESSTNFHRKEKNTCDIPFQGVGFHESFDRLKSLLTQYKSLNIKNISLNAFNQLRFLKRVLFCFVIKYH